MQRRKSGTLVMGVMVLIGILSGCGATTASDKPNEANLPVAIASFYPIAEMVERIGKGVVHVENLTPAGVEPHDVDLKPSDVERVHQAELVYYLGRGFAPAIEGAVSGRSKPSVEVSSGADLSVGDDDHGHGEDGHVHKSGETDPHYWLDPVRLRAATKLVEDSLVAAFPEQKDTLVAQATAYRDELTALDAEFSGGLATCESRTLVTSHAAFAYLADRYQLEQHPVVVNPDAEPDLKTLADLTKLIKAEGVTTVFSETLVSPRVAETLAREAGVKTAVLNPLEGLTKAELDAGKTYRSVMQDNLKALQLALRCA